MGRRVSIGIADNVVSLAVIHTDRNGVHRSISTRQANKKGRKHYEKELQKTFEA